MKIQQEVTFKHYNYLEEVLNYIRTQVPNDVKGEILENLCNVLPCQISCCNVSLAVDFEILTGKGLQ